MDDDVSTSMGCRLREVRAWRRLSQRATAELAGLSGSYLSMIENGQRVVDKRSTLESLAAALRVAPSELTGAPWMVDPVGAAAHATVVAVEAALECHELGEDPGGLIREWPEIAAEVDRLMDLTYVRSDYVGQGELVPRLLGELHGAYVRHPGHRADVLVGLIHCYTSACYVTKRLGGRGLPLLAARLAQRCAEELEVPQWRGCVAFLRGAAAGQLSRPQHYRRAVAMADELSSGLDEPEVVQAYGMLHLSAAFAAAAQSDQDTAATHLDEAAAVAGRLDSEVGTFARLWFGTVNVGIWRTSVATEAGEGGKITEIGGGVQAEAIPSPSRQAEFYADFGRSMLREKATREHGLVALLRAEKLAPQRVHNDVFVREAVADQLRSARRDAGGRELRGLAYRMGIAG